MATSSEQLLLLEKTDKQSSHTRTRSTLQSIMVMSSCFLSNMFAPGFNYGIIGAMGTAMEERFHITVDETSWTSAVHIAVFLLVAPWWEMLTRIITIRKMQLTGMILSAATIAICSLATRYEHVVITYGVFTAIGLSLLRATVFAIPVYHFDNELLSFATGLIMLGFTAGIMIFSVPVTEAFVAYGFNKGMLILTPFMSVHILGVIFFTQDSGKVPIKNLPQNRALRDSLLRLFTDSKVIVYIVGGFFHKFGISALLACINEYITKTTSMTLTDASKGTAIYGSMMCVGVIAVLISHALRAKYGKFVLYTVAATIYSILIIILTQVHSKIQYFAIMAGIGLTYGIQQGNLVAVAQELVGPGDMALVFAFETFLGGLGGLCGSPITSYLQEFVGVQCGLYASGFTLLIGAVMLAASATHSHIKQRRAAEKT